LKVQVNLLLCLGTRLWRHIGWEGQRSNHLPCVCPSNSTFHWNRKEFTIKAFKLCKSSSCFLWSFTVDDGKETVLESVLISEDALRITAILLTSPRSVYLMAQ
jgi:hypothetical protein